jgi:hypothetical protein
VGCASACLRACAPAHLASNRGPDDDLLFNAGPSKNAFEPLSTDLEELTKRAPPGHILFSRKGSYWKIHLG